MAKYSTLAALLTAIANSLRGKTGGTGKIVADDFPSVIDGLSTGGITPSGTKTITTNGTHDVTVYASAQVNVPTGITPIGTKTITANGSHDVTNYATAQVNVPVGITPSGSLSITANGTYDVTNKASAVVNVPAAAEKTAVRSLTVSTEITNTPWNAQQIIAADDFIKANYAKDGFSIALVPKNQPAGASGIVHFIYHGNRNIGASNVKWYGFVITSTGASTLGSLACTAKLNGEGYNVSLRIDSAGNLKIHVPSGRVIATGEYYVIMTCTD